MTTSTGSPPCVTPSAPTAGSGSTPTAPGTCRRRPTRCGGSAGYGLEYAEQPCRTVDELGCPPGRPGPGRRGRPGRGRRVDPARHRPLPGRAPGSGRHRRPQGAAARRRPGLPGDRRRDRPAGGRVERPGDLGGDRRRGGVGGGAARAPVRVRAEHRTAADRRPGRRSAGRRRRAIARARRRTIPRSAGRARCRRGHERVLAGSVWTRRGTVPRRTGRKGGTTVGDSSRCAQLVVTELLGAGVQEVVLSPGSRSAPLAYELFEADKIGLLRLHVRIDERTAGFLALGLAKASERPVAVVTTSGTAAANLHPAVLEAFHSHIPLVAMTADRPRAARHAGGNQTTDQAGLFARHVRAETQIDDAPSTPRSWRFELGRVLTAATGARSGTPGPVHLNLSFSEPLVPGVESAPIQPELLVTPRVTRPDPVDLPVGPQTLVVAGALSPSAGAAARAFAEQADLPLLAESVSNARGGPNALATGRLLLRTGLGEEIERVVMFGHPTLGPAGAAPARPGGRRAGRGGVHGRVDRSRHQRPSGDRCRGPGPRRRRMAGPVDRGRRGDVGTAGGGAGRARLPQRSGGRRPSLGGAGRRGHPRRRLVLSRPGTSTWRRSAPHHPTVYANRGLAGIDGTISTAIGVGLVVERPTHALVGDETFLHDTTGLIVGRHEQRPDLRIVVANDNGGAIFATLEHGHPIQSGRVRADLRYAARRRSGAAGHLDRCRLPPGGDGGGPGRGAGRAPAGHRGGRGRHRPAPAAGAGQRDRIAHGRGVSTRAVDAVRQSHPDRGASRRVAPPGARSGRVRQGCALGRSVSRDTGVVIESRRPRSNGPNDVAGGHRGL